MKNQVTGYRLQVTGKKIRSLLVFSGTSHLAPRTSSRGFTLIEMIVAVALFAVVMLVCVSALLSLVAANRKAQALQSVMNNLNVALDGMDRAVRMGSAYDGSVACSGNSGGGAKDCTNGSTQLSFQAYGKLSTDPRWVYVYDSAGIYPGCGTKQLCKSVDGGFSFIPITAPDITIDEMHFYVVGTDRHDSVQPKVVMIIKGSAGAVGSTARTTFHIQATSVQRVLDL